MGISALISHAQGKTHKQIESTNSQLSSLFSEPKSMPSSSKSNNSGNAKRSIARIDSMLLPVSVSIAEIKQSSHTFH